MPATSAAASATPLGFALACFRADVALRSSHSALTAKTRAGRHSLAGLGSAAAAKCCRHRSTLSKHHLPTHTMGSTCITLVADTSA